MTIADRWLLPDGIDEVLPPEAWQVEHMRREILDLYASWGYELVIPPHLEFLESLSAGAGSDLDLMTFKFTDQLSGRTLGLRADTTPAVARIDAHTLRRDCPVRLCYAGTVFHTKPASLTASRTPIQVGAELYGHSGLESDLEVISLMLESMAITGITQPHMDLGHVDIFRSLTDAAGLDAEAESVLFNSLQRKAVDEVNVCVDKHVNDAAMADMLKALPRLSGDVSVLDIARNVLSAAPAAVAEAIDQLAELAKRITALYPATTLYFDLGELRGYHYHTGIIFAAYMPGEGQAVAKGGRYDGVGEAFGRSRPATGFSADLKVLLRLGALGISERKRAILAPPDADPVLIRQLRGQGERVINRLFDRPDAASRQGCDRELKEVDGSWQVVPVS
ncbi:ATP phosphoribosyltransferase regulatory subunit [Sansalvadorimonas sp. 2012CJ34-2]|uniref:ATP phosphoribosyltransferase regulatory subunit n=1 Tax=Parendozoicomonas callyspongiae TaxID=2942213 RepID=A0ABT0PKR3_9GAMM|nr:ATP phosphoribosyltransferase regulatory subunit [Sansalvadorimonas sp. 2012CJ34-2]MCL6271982.1 ATP phosphoribosyltransferase regulatory subunit [Sansalvadorimonas sp. 2012CJ34-2]